MLASDGAPDAYRAPATDTESEGVMDECPVVCVDTDPGRTPYVLSNAEGEVDHAGLAGRFASACARCGGSAGRGASGVEGDRGV